MKRQIIRLTENDLHQIIRSTVNSIIKENYEDERHVLKIHNEEPPMPPMDEPPLNEPPMGAPEPQEPPMDNSPMNDGEEPPMSENEPSEGMDEPPMDDGGGNTQEIDDIFNSLDTEDQAAVIKYAKSMADDNGNDNEGNEPPMNNNMPMESKKNNIDRIVEDILGMEIRGKDRTSKRDNKKTEYGQKDKSPFLSKR